MQQHFRHLICAAWSAEWYARGVSSETPPGGKKPANKHSNECKALYAALWAGPASRPSWKTILEVGFARNADNAPPKSGGECWQSVFGYNADDLDVQRELLILDQKSTSAPAGHRRPFFFSPDRQIPALMHKQFEDWRLLRAATRADARAKAKAAEDLPRPPTGGTDNTQPSLPS